MNIPGRANDGTETGLAVVCSGSVFSVLKLKANYTHTHIQIYT